MCVMHIYMYGGCAQPSRAAVEQAFHRRGLPRQHGLRCA